MRFVIEAFEDAVDVDQLERCGVLAGNHGVDRDQVIVAADGKSVAGVKQQPDGGRWSALQELQQRTLHAGAIQVGCFDDLKADVTQRFGHGVRIIRRVRQLRRVAVTTVADDKSKPAARLNDRR